MYKSKFIMIFVCIVLLGLGVILFFKNDENKISSILIISGSIIIIIAGLKNKKN